MQVMAFAQQVPTMASRDANPQQVYRSNGRCAVASIHSTHSACLTMK